jgi:hypothetical protein
LVTFGRQPQLCRRSGGRRPGEWQTYDIIFGAPRFDGNKVVRPAYQTVVWNGVVSHNRQQVVGPMVYRDVARNTGRTPRRCR